MRVFGLVWLGMAGGHLIGDVFRKFPIFRGVCLFVISRGMYPLNRLFQRALGAHWGSLGSCAVKSNG